MNTFPIPMGVCLRERAMYTQWPSRTIDRLGQPCNLCIFFLFLFVQEVTEEIKRITFNGFSVTCTFAINERATLKDVRRKTDRELVGNAKAHKIPLQLLDPSLVEYIRHSKSWPSFLINNSTRPTYIF